MSIVIIKSTLNSPKEKAFKKIHKKIDFNTIILYNNTIDNVIIVLLYNIIVLYFATSIIWFLYIICTVIID